MAAEQGKGRRQFLMLVALFLGPVIAALALYFGGIDLRPKGSVNHGELISPVVQLPAVGDDEAFRGAWTLGVVAGPSCDESCEQALVMMRQIRLSLGREMERIERVLLIAQEPAQLDRVEQAHPGLLILDARTREFGALAAQFPGDPSVSIYLIDPLGNLMMRFDRATEPKAIRTDLKRLLRLSSIG
ncbi:MAG: SCO family protein [Gammaproteobacteria bacterium]